MSTAGRSCRNCVADISAKAPNAIKCDGCLAPRSGSSHSVANSNGMRVDVLGSTGGFAHETLTREQWDLVRSNPKPAPRSVVRGMSL